jgi:hypothetical protein
MTYAVRVSHDQKRVWLMERLVDEGQSVGPGTPLVNVMADTGVVETICAEGWGIVGHVEGNKLPSSANDENYWGQEDALIYESHAVLCHIVSRPDRGAVKTGLMPRNSRKISRLREHGL